MKNAKSFTHVRIFSDFLILKFKNLCRLEILDQKSSKLLRKETDSTVSGARPFDMIVLEDWEDGVPEHSRSELASTA